MVTKNKVKTKILILNKNTVFDRNLYFSFKKKMLKKWCVLTASARNGLKKRMLTKSEYYLITDSRNY